MAQQWDCLPLEQQSSSSGKHVLSQGINVSLSIHSRNFISFIFKPSVCEDTGVGLKIPWQKDGDVSIHLSHVNLIILSGDK